MPVQLYHVSPGHLVRRLQQIAVACFQRALIEEDLTPIQFAALTALSEFPNSDIQRVAEQAALDRSTVGTVIDRLVRAGLVERIVDPSDRRARLVRETVLGEDLLRRVAPKITDAQRFILVALPASGRPVFQRRLEHMVLSNEAHSRAPSPDYNGNAPRLSIFREPGHLIRRLRQICDGIFFQETERFDITPVQYASLITLRHYEGIDNAGLASLVALDQATLGEVVRRLRLKALIDVGVNPADRRSKLLRVTTEGGQLLTAMASSIQRVETRIMAPLSATEGAHFTRQMITIIRREQREDLPG